MNVETVGDLIHVTPRPAVVRLDDLESDDPRWISEGYFVTEEIGRFLESLRRWLARPHGGGAFLIGAYGCGKTHFLAFLAEQIKGGGFREGSVPDVAPLSLVNFPASRRLEEVVTEAVGGVRDPGDRRKVWAEIQSRHPAGLVLLIDELSEFLRSRPDAASFNEDVRFLQFLGEWARSQPLWVVAAVQEEVERTGRLESALYRKIRDRYPLRFMLTPAHVRDLVADHILERQPGFDEAIEELVRTVEAALPEASVSPDAVRRLYPIHPATLDLMEEVRDLFSQTRGAVEMVLSRLLGDPTRGIEPFLERPWGELLTPDVIVDHFADLLDVQPELLPLSQRLFPYYGRHMEELFTSPAQRELARRVLKLLVLSHLSPRREGLTATAAASWLLVRATTVAPAKNVAIIRRILDRLAADGRYVRVDGDRFVLDLADEGAQALKRLLPREVSELHGASPSAVWELLSGLLDGTPFNPFALPADRWQVRSVRWRFHERSVAFFAGNGDPQPPPAEVAIAVRLPWDDPPPAAGVTSVFPQQLELTPELVELAALIHLGSRAGAAPLKELVERRIAERRKAFATLIQKAYLEATLVDAEGARHTPPRPRVSAPLEAWLDELGLWALRRRFPSFEKYAPSAGPLPKQAYRRLMEVASEADLGDDIDDDSVKVIREGYLVPMGLMRREGWYYIRERRLDRNELVGQVLPLLDNRPSPATLCEHLQSSVYGLVPEQAYLLLVFLLLAGEIDILKGKVSYREMYRTMPLPIQYDAVVPGRSLPTERMKAVEELCRGLHLKTPRQWTALGLGRFVGRLRDVARRERERLEPVLVRLAKIDGAAALSDRIRSHLSHWSVLQNELSEIEVLERFLDVIGAPRRLLAEQAQLEELAGTVNDLLRRRERLRNLLAHPHLEGFPDRDAVSRLEAVGSPPPLDDPAALVDWTQRAEAAYQAYALAYARRHDEYWKRVAEHPIWSWRPPSVAGSRHLGLGDQVAGALACRETASRLRCRGLVDPNLGPRCACGFDGTTAPVEDELERFGELGRRLMAALEGFFAQDRVHEAVREWCREGLEVSEGAVAYVEGRRRLPEIDDVELFDRHLAGLRLVAEVPAMDLLEPVAGRAWEVGELVERLRGELERRSGVRVRITVPEAPADGRIASWCVRQCLQHAVPLPEGLAGRLPPAAVQSIEPGRVGPEALARIDRLGLGAELEEKVAGWILEGRVDAPAGEACPLTAAAREVVAPTSPGTARELASISRSLYLAHPRLARIGGKRWLDRLAELAEGKPAEPLPELAAVLAENTDRQWLVIDCLGLPLLVSARGVVERELAAWRIGREGFAVVASRTTTDVFWTSLAEEGLNHPVVKVNAVDRLLHERSLALADLEQLAAAELQVALRAVTGELDSARPLLLCADHGFRLDGAGVSFTHGGPSTLERTVPVLFLDPRPLTGAL